MICGMIKKINKIKKKNNGTEVFFLCNHQSLTHLLARFVREKNTKLRIPNEETQNKKSKQHRFPPYRSLNFRERKPRFLHVIQVRNAQSWTMEHISSEENCPWGPGRWRCCRRRPRDPIRGLAPGRLKPCQIWEEGAFHPWCPLGRSGLPDWCCVGLSALRIH